MGRRPSNGPNFDVLEMPIDTKRGVDLFVDTVNGNDARTGLTWERALATVEEACNRLKTPKYFGPAAYGKGNSIIHVVGDIREQFLAPLGVHGVKIRGATLGRPRHSTDGGVVVEGNGVLWRQSASVEGKPLLELRQQGWSLENILMVPESGYSCVKLHCEETATYPDASHFEARSVKFISGGDQVGYGLEDYGGAFHILVEDCEFFNLEFGWKQSNVGIRAPGAHLWQRNVFSGNKNDIAMNSIGSRFRDNFFHTVYHASTHPITLNLAYTADGGLATNKNFVVDNLFADNAADVTIAKGYKPATGDIWRNKVANTAADIVTVPT